MKILVTAFNPFGGEEQNAAEMVLQRLPEKIGDIELVKRIIPTEFNTCDLTTAVYIQKYQPNAVLMLGQAASRAQLTPERVAINVDDARIPR